MFPITTFDAGRRPGIDDSANDVMVSGVRPEGRTSVVIVSERSESNDEARTAVLTFTETIERTSDATDLILHS